MCDVTRLLRRPGDTITLHAAAAAAGGAATPSTAAAITADTAAAAATTAAAAAPTGATTTAAAVDDTVAPPASATIPQVMSIEWDEVATGSDAATAAVWAAYSAAGLGVLLVRHVPGLEPLRSRTLRAIHDIAALEGDAAVAAAVARREVGLGSDVPVRAVGSSKPRGGKAAPPPPPQAAGDTVTATLQFKWEALPPPPPPSASAGASGGAGTEAAASYPSSSAAEAAAGLKEDMVALGHLLTNVSAAVAGACDACVSARFPHCAAAPSLRAACVDAHTAKARLIHYRAGASPCATAHGRALAALGGWQAWHYDYGLLTALVSPTLSPAPPPASPPPPPCGLVVLYCGGGALPPTPVLIDIPPDAVAVQVGEAAEVLTGGALVATPHCVARPCTCSDTPAAAAAAEAAAAISRQIFVVFNQVPWAAPMAPPEGVPPDPRRHAQDAALAAILPPLASRLAPGMTFSDFSTATTRAYYARGGGMQSTTL